jgi:hypothetical protein
VQAGPDAARNYCLVSFVKTDRGCSSLSTAPTTAGTTAVFVKTDRSHRLGVIGTDEKQAAGTGLSLPA